MPHNVLLPMVSSVFYTFRGVVRASAPEGWNYRKAAISPLCVVGKKCAENGLAISFMLLAWCPGAILILLPLDLQFLGLVRSVSADLTNIC